MSAQREIETPRTMAFFSRPDICIDAAKAHSINLERELAETNHEIDRISCDDLEPARGIGRAIEGKQAVGNHPLALEVQSLLNDLREQNAALKARVERLDGVALAARDAMVRYKLNVDEDPPQPYQQVINDLSTALAETPAPKNEGGAA
jgi:hypothetical protein